ncbi:hypothetical protein HY004_00045 [Candidatus Saccharibacteria bacterium]|nr:hypothetical protein [Candidatus Saccharibacteria bacterium]
MAEQDMNKFEARQVDDTELPVDPVEVPSDASESTSEPAGESSEDPTLRVISSEFAIYGLSRATGHEPTGHVWGD